MKYQLYLISCVSCLFLLSSIKGVNDFDTFNNSENNNDTTNVLDNECKNILTTNYNWFENSENEYMDFLEDLNSYEYNLEESIKNFYAVRDMYEEDHPNLLVVELKKIAHI